MRRDCWATCSPTAVCCATDRRTDKGATALSTRPAPADCSNGSPGTATKNWEFAYDSPTHLAHHDFEVLPNGNILLIAWELKTEAEATQAGRDPNLPGPGYLYPDHIVEVHPDYINGGGTIVWEWHIWDHLVQQFDNTKDNWHGATGVQEHPELINVNYVSSFDEGAGDPQDWTHMNGIDYNPDLDQIVVSVARVQRVLDHRSQHDHGRGGEPCRRQLGPWRRFAVSLGQSENV